MSREESQVGAPNSISPLLIHFEPFREIQVLGIQLHATKRPSILLKQKIHLLGKVYDYK